MKIISGIKKLGIKKYIDTVAKRITIKNSNTTRK